MRYGGKLLWLLLVLFFAAPALPVQAAEPDIGASSAIVIEASTGRVVYEKNADRRMGAKLTVYGVDSRLDFLDRAILNFSSGAA